MSSSKKFIPRDIVARIIETADLVETVQHFQPDLKKSGSSYKGECPNCNSERFSITPSKNIVKCFKCLQGGSGAIGYLQKLQGMEFTEACVWLAEKYSISLDSGDETYVHPDHKNKGQHLNADPSHFRNAQLAASGIPDQAQQWIYDASGEEEQRDRYTAGCIDHLGHEVPGYDMLLHYIDLDGKPIMYKHDKTKKDVPYIRIRYARPDQHVGKDGKDIRYKTPKGGGNHLWLPEFIRRAYKEETEIRTLAFVEGEKKSDAMCLAGMPACGIAGIHNFSETEGMPLQIEQLIRTCRTRDVVFFFDSDYDDLGSTIPSPADSRVRSFYKAAVKFKKYFEAYRSEGFDFNIYIAHGIDRTYKGMDDLLVSLASPSKRKKKSLPQLPDLSEDLRKALHGHGDAATHIKAYDITDMHEYKMQEIWHIHSYKAFKDFYADRLKTVPEFKLGGLRYAYNKVLDKFELTEKLMPGEKFWRERYNSRSGRTEYDFYYTGMNEFLAARGYGQYEITEDQYRLIHQENNIVTALQPQKISRYVLDFSKTLDNTEIHELILRGGEQYMGSKRLTTLPMVQPRFIEPQKDRQIMAFKDGYWEITPEGIKPHSYKTLPGKIWKDDIIDFSPELIKDFITLTPPKQEGEAPVIDSDIEDSDILRYFQMTSDILWRTHEDGSKEAVNKRVNTMLATMADKIIATGYILSQYMDPAQLKAVICMDALESESGRSEGGTGKSLFFQMFKHVIPTEIIPAKSPKLTEDAFLYETVTERTRFIGFDDCRRNLDFEAFLADITYGISVNRKGMSRYFIGPRRIGFTTNHAIRGDDRSYIRRQYILAFSDYFNNERTPFTVFKHSMFVEWDKKQWNYFYNLMAHCLQIFMKHGLITFAPSADIQRRKLRDAISENLLDFLEGYFYHGSEMMNRRHDIAECIKHYVLDNPSQRMYCTKRYMRDRLAKFCEYAGFTYNPSSGGKRIRNGSTNTEFFVIADADYDPNQEKLLMGVSFDSQPQTES